MTHYKRDEVVAIEDEVGLYHVECFEDNLHEISANNVITKNDMNDEDYYFCNSCEKRLN